MSHTQKLLQVTHPHGVRHEGHGSCDSIKGCKSRAHTGRDLSIASVDAQMCR